MVDGPRQFAPCCRRPVMVTTFCCIPTMSEKRYWKGWSVCASSPTSLQPTCGLSDFVASADSGTRDYAGLFAVTTGHGIEQAKKNLPENDDYSGILLQALADRLAEALAEALHAKVRRELWGLCAGRGAEQPRPGQGKKYRGIRPAPGYPACPDHSEKEKIFKLLDAPGNIGVELTDSFAMHPAAAVSGYYIGHPESKYFVVGKTGQGSGQRITPDERTFRSTRLKKFLRPNLEY